MWCYGSIIELFYLELRGKQGVEGKVIFMNMLICGNKGILKMRNDFVKFLQRYLGNFKNLLWLEFMFQYEKGEGGN